ncbi:MAG: hypothetical protein ACREMD_09645 [Gemmatimonadota bacterium]
MKTARPTVRRLFFALIVMAGPAACGDAGGPSDVDDQAPAAPDLARIEVVPPVADSIARLVGSPGAVDAEADRVRVANPDATIRNGGQVVEALTTPAFNGSFLLAVPAELGDALRVTAIDEAGNESQVVTTDTGPEPDAYTGEAVGDVQRFPLGNGGAVTLPFETGEERFAVVAQSLNPSGQPFELKVTGGMGARIEARELAGAAQPTHRASAETRIRELERRLLPILAGRPQAPARELAAAQDIGDARNFFVINRTDEIDVNNQAHFDEVMATLRYVGDNTEIWVDDRMPEGNLPASVLQSIGDTFDDETYPTDRAVFGEESDVDSNGRINIVLTPTVNALNTEASVEEGVALFGFFFGVDLGPTTVFPFSNQSEVFYAVVPDPGSEFSPLDIPVEGIDDLLSSIFAHEFEHMISANQHILERSGQAEAVWLDEGLAHFAETLNGFHVQNRLRSALFLDDPENTSLVGGEDTLERRGAAWLLVRYMVDRFGEEILGQLVQTSLTGIPNVESVTDRSMPFLFHEWVSALFLDGTSDDPIFDIPSLDVQAEFLLAKQIPSLEIGEYLGIVERILDPTSAATIARDVNGLAAAYYVISADGPGPQPIVLSPASGANLQAAVFRIE